MKKSVFIIFITIFYSCNAGKLLTEYKLYQRDKTINYPEEKLSIKFANDTIGLFVNAYKNRETFNQKFIFYIAETDYLVIKSVGQINTNIIALRQGDTIFINKNRLHFFYNGNKKYFLSFKKM